MNRALGDLKNNAHQLKWLHNIFSTASKAHVSMKRSYGIFLVLINIVDFLVGMATDQIYASSNV